MAVYFLIDKAELLLVTDMSKPVPNRHIMYSTKSVILGSIKN